MAWTTQAIDAKGHEQRIEHFHPKEDRIVPFNWAFHWPSPGGFVTAALRAPPDGVPITELQLDLATARNLSCDAHKDFKLQANSASERAGLSHPMKFQVSTAFSICSGWVSQPRFAALHVPHAS